MPKRFSSTEGRLGLALSLARKGRCEEAQQLIRGVAGRNLMSFHLRTIAQVNSRCGLLDNAEACWLEIDRRGEMEPGDFYMFGTLRVRLSKLELAARCFEREIAMGTTTGERYFVDSSVIRLADLFLRLGQPLRAREVLAVVGDDAGEYVDGIGFRTKVAILREVDLREKNGPADDVRHE